MWENNNDEDGFFVCQFGKFINKKGYGARRIRSSSKIKEDVASVEAKWKIIKGLEACTLPHATCMLIED
jgi:hypothetical protein